MSPASKTLPTETSAKDSDDGTEQFDFFMDDHDPYLQHFGELYDGVLRHDVAPLHLDECLPGEQEEKIHSRWLGIMAYACHIYGFTLLLRSLWAVYVLGGYDVFTLDFSPETTAFLVCLTVQACSMVMAGGALFASWYLGSFFMAVQCLAEALCRYVSPDSIMGGGFALGADGVFLILFGLMYYKIQLAKL